MILPGSVDGNAFVPLNTFLSMLAIYEVNPDDYQKSCTGEAKDSPTPCNHANQFGEIVDWNMTVINDPHAIMLIASDA